MNEVASERGQAGLGAAHAPLLLDGQRSARRSGDWLLAAGLGVSLLVVWEVAVLLFNVPRWLLPAPTEIAVAVVESAPLLVVHAWITLSEVLIGFAASFVLGVALAVAIVRSPVVERALYPYVVASQTIPVIAIAPLLLIWFGYGLGPKVIVVVLICFFPIVVNLVDGLRSVDRDLVNLLRTMGASQRQVLTMVQVPAALPFLMSGVKIAISVSVIGAVIGEWVGAQAGLGYFMVRSAAQFQTARVFAAVLVLCLMGVALFGLAALIERRVLGYRRRGAADWDALEAQA